MMIGNSGGALLDKSMKMTAMHVSGKKGEGREDPINFALVINNDVNNLRAMIADLREVAGELVSSNHVLQSSDINRGVKVVQRSFKLDETNEKGSRFVPSVSIWSELQPELQVELKDTKTHKADGSCCWHDNEHNTSNGHTTGDESTSEDEHTTGDEHATEEAG